MSRTFISRMGNEKCMQDFDRETLREETIWGSHSWVGE